MSAGVFRSKIAKIVNKKFLESCFCDISGLKMYPSKSMVDYMTEMNRLFPRGGENDLFNSVPTPSSSLFDSPNSTSFGSPSTTGFQSPFSIPTINRSSSSADSTSPESFPELSTFTRNETPFSVRRQRPIIGRKIFDNTPSRTEPTLSPIWPDQPLATTPPNINVFVEQKNTQNVFYELFPTQKKDYEFSSPVKVSQSPTPMSTSSFPPSRPSTPRPPTPFVPRPRFSPSRQQNNNMCTFCRKNGETPLVYTTHTVRAVIGGRTVVTCPILRSHVCMTCGGTGDDAHTITYCPILRSSNNGRPLQSTTITLKNTRIKSNGRRRF